MGRRLAPGNPFQTGEWDGFVELTKALRGERGGVPRGVYRFRTFEALQWEERMLRGEVPERERRGHCDTVGAENDPQGLQRPREEERP